MAPDQGHSRHDRKHHAGGQFHPISRDSTICIPQKGPQTVPHFNLVAKQGNRPAAGICLVK